MHTDALTDFAIITAALALLFATGGARRIRETAVAVWFEGYKLRVRQYWRAHVDSREDIIALTGDRCWRECFAAGHSPEHAVEFGYEAG